MKKISKFNRLLSFFLTICLIFIAVLPSAISPAYAAATYKVTCTDSGLNFGAGSQSTFERSDGTVVYCGEHDVYSPVAEGDTDSFSFSLYNDEKMVTKVLFYGKGGPKEWSGFDNYTKKQAKCITALALSNAYIATGDAKSAAVKVDLDDVKGLKNFWNDIKNQPVPDTDRFDVYRYVGDAWTQSLFTFEYYPKGDGALVKKSSHSYTTSGNGYDLKGAKYGVYKTKGDAAGNKNKVGTLTTVSGGTSNTLTLDVGTYYVKETVAPEGFEVDETIHTMDIKEDEKTTLTVKDKPLKGSLQIIKKSNNSNTAGSEHYSLEGAVFKVYRDKEKSAYVTTLTTDKDGKTPAFTCIADTYYIYETKAPKGFKLYEDVITAKVTIGQELVKTITDEAIRGKIQIKKVSADRSTSGNENYSLEGAKFSIYRDKEKKNKVTTLTTDENGLTETFTCIADTYYVYEDAAPKGFKLIEGLAGSFDTGNAFLNLGQAVYVYEIKEQPISGSIQIIKSSSDEQIEGNPNYSLEGAKFSIYRDKAKTEKVTTLITDKDGKTPAFTCIADTYYVFEDEAPKGFRKIDGLAGTFDTSNHFIKLGQDYICYVKNEPIKGSLQIVKEAEYDDVLKNPENYTLENAIFGVYRDKACKTLIKTLTTDADGKTETFQVYADRYYIKELSAPKGFILNEQVFEASVIAGQKKIITIEEKAQSGFAKVKKNTAGGDIHHHLVGLCPQYYTLEGAKYQIYQSKEDAEMLKDPIAELMTDSYGNTNEVELQLGRYWVKEVEASKGYQLDEKLYELNIAAGETAVITSEEIPKFYSIPVFLTKTDAESKETPVEGAEFTVKYYQELTEDVEGLEPLKEWVFKTDENGSFGLSDKDKIGGDTLFKNADGEAVALIGTYEVVETRAPKGYLLDSTARLAHVKVDGSEGFTFSTIETTNKPQKVRIVIQKTDDETGKTVPQQFGSFLGAVYELCQYDEMSKEYIVIDTMMTDAQGKAESKLLAPGVYQIKEVQAPAGYTINPDILTVYAEAKESEDAVIDYDVVSLEKATNVEIYKYEKGTRRFVNDAVLAVYDADGEEMIQWVTTGEPYVIKSLPTGNYTLKELSAPEGYLPAEDISFAVEATDEVQIVVMEDELAVLSEPDAPIETSGNEEPEFQVPQKTMKAEPVECVEVSMPETGDENPLLTWIFLAMTLGIGLIAVIKHKKQRF